VVRPNLSDMPYHWRKNGSCGGLRWLFRADNTIVVDEEQSFGYSWTVGGWWFYPAYEKEPAHLRLRLAHLHTFIPAAFSDLKLTVKSFADGRLTFSVDGETYHKGQPRPPLKSLTESNWLCRDKR